MSNAIGDECVQFQLGDPGFRFWATDALEHRLSAAAEAFEVFHQSWILLGLTCYGALVARRWSSLQTTLIKSSYVELSRGALWVSQVTATCRNTEKKSFRPGRTPKDNGARIQATDERAHCPTALGSGPIKASVFSPQV